MRQESTTGTKDEITFVFVSLLQKRHEGGKIVT